MVPCETSLVTVLGFGNEEGWQSCTVLSGGLYCRHVCCTFDQPHPHYFLIVRLGDVSSFQCRRRSATCVLVKWPCLFLAVASCNWRQECRLRAFVFGFLPKLERTGFVHERAHVCLHLPLLIQAFSVSSLCTFFAVRSLHIPPNCSYGMVSIFRCRLGITMKSAVEPYARQ